MPQLPLNTQYEKPGASYSPFLQSAAKTVGKLQKSVQPPPSQRFSNVASAVQRPQQQAQGQPQGQQTSNGGGYRPLGKVTVPYGGSTRYEAFHPGIDLANAIGTPIPALRSGIVTQVVGGKKQGDPGYGNYAIIQDEQGNTFRYSHLNRGMVQVGQQIQRGQVLGTVGNTGQTYSESGGIGAHLDLRVRNAFGAYVNPASFFRR